MQRNEGNKINKFASESSINVQLFHATTITMTLRTL